ncbi:MAG: flagellar hook assembly protein FlgD, partial [FCB group bacterium]|nr:flagellar hook assembly protein FlgD [FCB group bacterium]
EIRDSAGTLVRNIEKSDQDTGDHSITWDGLNDNGDACDAGDYTFSVRAENDQGVSVSTTTYLTGVIESVKFENGMAMLIVNGQEVPFSQVLEVS